jgi:hypothetical protein
MRFANTIPICAVASAAALGADLIVHYHNEARVPEKPLALAIETAAQALRRAEIQVRWVNCYANAEACKVEPATAGVVLQVSIAGAPTNEFRAVSSFAMGYSLLPEQGQGVYAKVMWPRVMKYSIAFDVPAALVLGNAIAHEVGHLLLGTGEHSHRGIMRAQWSGAEKFALEGGRLGFQGHEAARMRRRVAVLASAR